MKTIHCTIDGGITVNPGGKAYGSFEIDGQVYRRTYGEGRGHTNNTAEVETALEALLFIAEQVSCNCFAAAETRIVFHTDSMLTVNWINRGKNPRTGQVFRLVELLKRFRQQARGFASVTMEWHPREASVAVLGH